MEWGDIIFVVAIGLAFVWQVVSKKLKTKRPATDVEQQPEILSDTFGDVVYEPHEEDAQAECAPVYADAPGKETAEIYAEGVTAHVGAEEREHTRPVHARVDKAEQSLPSWTDIDLSDAAEARKAFIYSEIFNRKY